VSYHITKVFVLQVVKIIFFFVFLLLFFPEFGTTLDPGGNMADKKEKDESTVNPQVTDAVEETTSGQIVHKYMYWSMGVGLVPIPLLDLTALTGIQIKMLYDLAKHYNVEFHKKAVKSILVSLLGAATAGALRKSGVTTFIKAIPIIGFVGAVSMTVYNGATTYAVGKLFSHHFENGGTFLDVDLKKFKDNFKKHFDEGKEKVKNKNKKEAAPSAA
jgi:uncharacterized protein (DUF697 family)